MAALGAMATAVAGHGGAAGPAAAPANSSYAYGAVVPFEEDERHEFKRCTGPLAKHVLAPSGDVTKNVVAFLNSPHGGTLFLGIDDDGTVRGAVMSRAERDKFRLAVNRLTRNITPVVLPSLVAIEFVPVVGGPAVPASPRASAHKGGGGGGGSGSGGSGGGGDDDDAEAAASASHPPDYKTWRNARQTGETNKQKRAVYLRTFGHLLGNGSKGKGGGGGGGGGSGESAASPASPVDSPVDGGGDGCTGAAAPPDDSAPGGHPEASAVSPSEPPESGGGADISVTPDGGESHGSRSSSGGGGSGLGTASVADAGAPASPVAAAAASPTAAKRRAKRASAAAASAAAAAGTSPCGRCGRGSHAADTCRTAKHIDGSRLDAATAATPPVRYRVVVEIAVKPGLGPGQPVPYENSEHVAFSRRAGETGPLTGVERFQMTELVLRGHFGVGTTARRSRVRSQRNKAESKLCTLL